MKNKFSNFIVGIIVSLVFFPALMSNTTFAVVTTSDNTMPSLTLEKFKVIKDKNIFSTDHNIDVVVRNNKNSLVKVKYITTISSVNSKEELRKFEESSEIPPEEVIFNNFLVQGAPTFGKFLIKLNIYTIDDKGNEEFIDSKEEIIVIIPYFRIIFIIFALIYLVREIYLKVKYNSKGWVEYTINEGDTLESIIKDFNIDWNKFVRINDIKAPYLLKKGDKVLVPRKKK